MEYKFKKVKVKSIYPINDQQAIIAHLASIEWEYNIYGFVYLCFDKIKVRMKYIAFANINGDPALWLTPFDITINNVEDICKVSGGDVYIERDI